MVSVLFSVYAFSPIYFSTYYSKIHSGCLQSVYMNVKKKNFFYLVIWCWLIERVFFPRSHLYTMAAFVRVLFRRIHFFSTLFFSIIINKILNIQTKSEAVEEEQRIGIRGREKNPPSIMHNVIG